MDVAYVSSEDKENDCTALFLGNHHLPKLSISFWPEDTFSLLALGLAESRTPGIVYVVGQILICKSHASQYTEEENIKYKQTLPAIFSPNDAR